MAASESGHLSLAKRLAHSSSKETRDAAFATISAWLDAHKTADEDEYMKLWKALFYCVWYSDKVPVQQELVFNIARLTRRLHGDSERAVLFLQTFFQTMQREWLGIDHLRLDKYMSLMRRMVHESLALIAASKWDGEVVKAVVSMYTNTVLKSEPNGIRYHVADVFLDEVSAAMPTITVEQLQTLLVPFYSHCIITDDKFLFERIVAEVLQGLISRVSTAQLDGEAAKSSAPSSKILSPVLVDAEFRLAAAAKAWKHFSLAPIAKDVFSMAAFASTRPSHRERLYALQKEFVSAALSLKHIDTDKSCLPQPLTSVTAKVAKAIAIVAPAATPKVEASELAMSGTKRRRADESAAVASELPSSKKAGKSAAKADAEDVLPAKAIGKSKGSVPSSTEEPSKAKKARRSGEEAEKAAPAASAEAKAEKKRVVSTGDPMASIPTVGELKLKSNKTSAPSEAPKATAPARREAASEPASAPVKSILKKKK